MPRTTKSSLARPATSGAPAAVAEAGETAAEPPQRLSVETVEDGGDWSAFGNVDALVAAAVRALSVAPEIAAHLPATACIALSTDAAVRALNAQWRGQDKATNVLSFPSDAPSPPGPSHPRQATFLGDVILADGVVTTEARELGLPPAHHLQHLVIHGFLHLMGFDHETEGEAAEMEALETRILAALGIADPYAAID